VSGGAAGDPQDAAQWWERLADALADVGRRVGQLAEQIAQDWPDASGREWAERAGQVGTELGREAAVASEIGAGYARRSAEVEAEPALPTAGMVAGRRPGVRLGGTEAHRVDDERGIRIAELPEPPR
jgi:hypothetical protein